MGSWVWPFENRSSVSEVTEGISTFSFCSALNKVYFVVWVSPVVQSSSTHR